MNAFFVADKITNSVFLEFAERKLRLTASEQRRVGALLVNIASQSIARREFANVCGACGFFPCRCGRKAGAK